MSTIHYLKLSTCASVFALMSVGPVQAGTSEEVSNLVLITNWADHTVSMVNLDLSEEKARIAVGPKPYDIKVGPKGRFAYTTLSGGSEVSIIDLQANLESERIQVGEGPRDLIMTKDGKMLITANAGSNTISVVDVETKQEMFQVPVGMIPYGIALANDEKHAVVTNWGAGSVSIVDLNLRREIAEIPVGTLPYTVAVPEDGKFAYVTVFGDNKIAVVDLENQTHVGGIDTDRSPWGLTISQNGEVMAAANFYTGGITVVHMDDVSDLADIASYETMAYRPIVEQAHRAGINLTSNDAGEDPRSPGTDAPGPSSIRSKNVAAANDGTIVFTDLANNTLGVMDAHTGEYGSFVKVGQAPYGLAFIQKPKDDRAELNLE